jgi:hypothetical protein
MSRISKGKRAVGSRVKDMPKAQTGMQPSKQIPWSLRGYVLSAAIWLLIVNVATATPVTWTLSNVQFSEGSTVTGSLTYDADTKAVSNVNVTFTGVYFKSGQFSFGASGSTSQGIYIDLSTAPIASINTVGNYVLSLPLSPAPTNGGGVVQITDITGCVVVLFQGGTICDGSGWGVGTLPPDPPTFVSGRLVAGLPLSVTATALPTGEEGVAYPPAGPAAQLVAGGTPPYQILTNGLPAGLHANSDGTLTGVPAVGAAGSHGVSVTASDSAGASVGPVGVTLNITPAQTTTFYPFPRAAMVWPIQGGYTPYIPFTGTDSCIGPINSAVYIPPPFQAHGGGLRILQPLEFDSYGHLTWSFFGDVLTYPLPAGPLIPVVNGQIQIPGLPKIFGPVSTSQQGITTRETYTISASGTVLIESWSSSYGNGSDSGTNSLLSTYDVTTGLQTLSAHEVSSGPACTLTMAGTGSANWITGPTSGSTGGPDHVSLSSPGAQSGLLINGLVGGSQWSHHSVMPSAANPIDLGFNVTSSTDPNGNTIVAFTDGHPPTLQQSVNWTAQSDTIAVPFRASSDISIKVWIVSGTRSKPKVEDDIDHAARMWSSERLGYRLVNGGISDVRNVVVGRPRILAKDQFKTANCLTLAKIIAQLVPTGDLGHNIGVFYVDAVDSDDPGYTVNGLTCARDGLIIIAGSAQKDVLAHELGHSLSLQHTCQPYGADCTAPVTALPGFNRENVMVQYVSGVLRKYLSEGQTFRANFDADSSLHLIYGVPGSGVLTCASRAETLACPALEKRLWDDGQLKAVP